MMQHTTTENQQIDEAAGAQSPAQEETSALKEIAQLNEQRMATYGLIARMYRVEMDAAALDEMHGMLFPAATGDERVDKGFRMLATYLSRMWGNTVTELAVDYSRTFIGNTNEIDGAAFPYESVYTSERHLVMQAARDEVLAIYRANGMKKDDGWKDAEDHVAMELEFMKALCQKAADALADGEEEEAEQIFQTQLNFLDDHLLSWTPLLTQDVRKFAKTDFYQGLSYLTDGFLDTDREFLGDLLLGEAE